MRTKEKRKNKKKEQKEGADDVSNGSPEVLNIGDVMLARSGLKHPGIIL